MSLPKDGTGEEAEEQTHGEVKGGSGEDEGGKRKTSSMSGKGGAVDGKDRENVTGAASRVKEERLGPRKTRVVIKVRFHPSSLQSIISSLVDDRC